MSELEYSFDKWGQLNLATVALFNTQNVATVATFNTQNIATLGK